MARTKAYWAWTATTIVGAAALADSDIRPPTKISSKIQIADPLAATGRVPGGVSDSLLESPHRARNQRTIAKRKAGSTEPGTERHDVAQTPQALRRFESEHSSPERPSAGFASMKILPAQAESERSGQSSEARYDAAFEAMMQDLSDPELAFEFAEAAVEVGDVRGAIAALERILLLNPNLPNIALELGLLYRRVGNNMLAAQYLEQVLAAEEVPRPMRERAEAVLAAAQSAVSRHQLRGSLFAGLRGETNANAAPEVARIGGRFEVEPDEDEQEDLSFIGFATLEYDYLLGTQAGDAIEVNAVAFGQQYLELEEQDTELIGLDVGPRLHLGPVEDPWSALRPFAEASYVRLGGERFLARYGGGIEAEKAFLPRLFADSSLTLVQQDFSNTEDQPTAEEESGLQFELETGLAYLLRPTTTLSARFDYTRRDADESFEAFNEFALAIAATERYRGPFELADVPWSATLSFEISYADYDEPEPQIDPDDNRQDLRIDVALTNNLPLSESLSFRTTARYVDNQSSLPNFEYDNFSLTGGVSWRF